jgi:hypothetical protein
MSSRNTAIQLRTITIVGASAVVAALLVGYLLLKSDNGRKKTKKKSLNESVTTAKAERVKEEEEACGVSEPIVDNIVSNDVDRSATTVPLTAVDITSSCINEHVLDCDVVNIVDMMSNSSEITDDRINDNEPNGNQNSNDNNNHASTMTMSDDVSSDSGNGESDTMHAHQHHQSSPSIDDSESQKMPSYYQAQSSYTIATSDGQQSGMPESTSSVSISSSTSQYSELDVIVYEFQFPAKLCGKLIGRNGAHVDYIRKKTSVQIAVRDDSTSGPHMQVVSITGLICNVDQALEIISARFPSRTYPNISFRPITKPIIYKRNNDPTHAQKVFVSQTQFVQLSTSTHKFDVHVSAIVNSTHLFIQLPFNETYEYLQRLDEDMLHLYGNLNDDIPSLHVPLDYGTICAAPTSYGWHRAMVTHYYSKDDTSVDRASMLYYCQPDDICDIAQVKFLDYGGYLNIPASQLKQLRFPFFYLL